jgi:hypothetical protein
MKSQYIVYRGKKLALTCSVCVNADDPLTSEKSRCVQCLKNGRTKFQLDKKYRDAKQGEHELDTDEEENEHATLKKGGNTG